MVICESYMFEFNVSKDIKKNDKKIPTYLLAYLLTLIAKKFGN